MPLQPRWALIGLMFAIVGSGTAVSTADDYLATLQNLSRSVEEYRSLGSKDAQKLSPLLRDLEAVIARPRFLSPELLRQLGRQIRAKAPGDDSGVRQLLSLVEDVARQVDLGKPSDWPKYCRSCADKITAITPVDLAAERSRLLAQLARLEPLWAACEPAARGEWEQYLFWDETKALASGEKFDPGVLDRLDTRWANSVFALSNPSAATTAIAVQRFVHLARRAANDRTPEDWARLLRDLADVLERQPNEGAAGDRLVRMVLELERNGVAAELGNAVRRRFSHPNATLVVSANASTKHLTVPLDEKFGVNGFFGGVLSRGEGQLTGKLNWSPVASPGVARWMWQLEAVSRSRSTGNTQGVSVVSQGVTSVRGRKLFEWGAAGLTTFAAEAVASAKVNFENIDAGGRRRRRGAATSGAYATLPQAERDAAAAAERSAKERLDGQGAHLLAETQAIYDREFRLPAALSLDAVSTVESWSTETEYHWLCRYEPLGAFAAPTQPPSGRSDADACVNLHETFVAGLLASRLCGRKMTGQDFATRFSQFVGGGSDAISSSHDWHVRWAKHSPVTCQFAADSLQWEFRTEEFTTPEGVFPGFLLRVAYHLKRERDGHAYTLVRDEPLIVYPRGYDPSTKQKLTGRQLLLRKAATRRLETVLAPRLPLQSEGMPFTASQLPRVHLVELKCTPGWLSAQLDLRRSPVSRTAGAETPSAQ